MAWYVITDDEHRACTEPAPYHMGYLCEEVSNPGFFDELFREDTREFRVEGGKLVFDPTPEQEAFWRASRADDAGAVQAELDAAICEVYEALLDAQAVIAEQDAAICELYEMAIGEA